MLHHLSTLFIIFFIHGYKAQQTYVDNKQLDCDNTYTTASGYTCNAAASCLSYVTFRSQPPLYNTPLTIAKLLNSNPNNITSINNLTSNSATIPADTVVIVPISNCSCSGNGSGRYYQHNASYELIGRNETYFSVANNTFQGLTTCQAMIAQNTYDYQNLLVGDNITVPIRCACPTVNQTANGIRYLITYLITWGDNYDLMTRIFPGVDVQSILYANELSLEHIIFPFTPILIPIRNTPTKINVPVTPAPPPAPPVIPVTPGGGSGSGSGSKWIFAGVGIGVGLLLIVSVSVFLFWIWRKRKIQRQGDDFPPVNRFPATGKSNPVNSWSISSEGVRIAVGSLTVYKYEELQMATGDFSDENRVNGSVYQGVFNGDSAAVKVMEGDVSGEINILKQINHSNIIRLSGFCLHQGNTYLVYEFADNYSLSDWLHSKDKKYESVLDWKQRVQIAHDIADGLNYLHNFITPPYIHKNLKSSNVLLDGNMRAKITNFGLARRVEHDDNGELQLTRHVVGTFGYMPPEYIENGLITPKMDVFALGVLISELLSGKEAATRSPTDDGKDVADGKEMQLSEMVREVVRVGDNVREKLVGFMDGRLGGEYPVELAYSMVEIACKCVARDLNERPSMAEVFGTLAKILSASLDWDPSDELEHSRSLSHGR